jgi:hypothetical protein
MGAGHQVRGFLVVAMGRFGYGARRMPMASCS